jgi:hypothetical protein
MNLTKGKISKLYGKKRQSLRKPKRSGARNRKTFRKRHFNLATKSLKRYGGMDGVQDSGLQNDKSPQERAKEAFYTAAEERARSVKRASDDERATDDGITPKSREQYDNFVKDLNKRLNPNKETGEDSSEANQENSSSGIPSQNIVSTAVGNDQAQEAAQQLLATAPITIPKDASELAAKSAVPSALLASNIKKSEPIEQAAANSAVGVQTPSPNENKNVSDLYAKNILSNPNIIAAKEKAAANLSTAKTDANDVSPVVSNVNASTDPASIASTDSVSTASTAVAPTAAAHADPGPSPLAQQSCQEPCKQDNDLSKAFNTIVETLADKVAERLGGPHSSDGIQNGFQTVNRNARELADQSARDKATISSQMDDLYSHLSSKMGDMISPAAQSQAAVAPDAVAPDAVAPDAVAPDVPIAPNTAAPDVPIEPNTAAPDAVAPDAVAPDAVAPIADNIDSSTEDVAVKPDAVAPYAADTGLSTNATPFASPPDNALLPPTAPNNLLDNNDAYTAGELDDNPLKGLGTLMPKLDQHESSNAENETINTIIPFSSQNKPNNGGRNKRTRRFKVHRKKATRRYRTGK